MRAFLLIDEKLFSDKKSKHHLKPIHKLFRNAGKIRTAQVNMELMDMYSISNSPIEKQQTVILISESEKLYSDIERYLKFFKKYPDYFLNRFHTIHDDELKKIVDKEIKEIEICFFENIKTKELHDCRKKIKILYYQSGSFSSRSLKKIKLKTEYLKKLEQAIGKWHDTDLVTEIAGKSIQKRNVIKRLQTERKKQLEGISKMAGNFRKKLIAEK
jgi:CHAD domain-containing protein